MNDQQPEIFCPIRNCGCDDLSCNGVLPVNTHDDCREYDDGELRLRLVCLKGDAPYELPFSYSQDELDQLIAEYESNRPATTTKRRYKTRKTLTIAQAAKITGFGTSTIKRLDKDPKNSNYPGRNTTAAMLAAWAKLHRGDKREARKVRAANRPLLGAERR